MNVIIVTSFYNETPCDSRIVGVWGNNESFLKGIREELKDYAEEAYTQEGLETFDFTSSEEFAEHVLDDLRKYDEAQDPIDPSQKWVLYDLTVKYLDYPKEIVELIQNSLFGWKEDKEEMVFYLDFFKLAFYPTARDGSGEIIPCNKLVLRNSVLYLKDRDGDYWDVSKEPIEKQRHIYKSVEGAIEEAIKEKN